MANADLPKRRNSLRYPGYDYSQAGALFVTICTYNRQPLFGSVVDGLMIASPQGESANLLWARIPDRFPGVLIDTFLVMPDHLHSVIFIGTDPEIPLHPGHTLSEIVKWFKVTAQVAYSRNAAEDKWPRYRSHLWQRNYHDRIIRNDRELDAIRDYIMANPARWQERKDAADT